MEKITIQISMGLLKCIQSYRHKDANFVNVNIYRYVTIIMNLLVLMCTEGI